MVRMRNVEAERVRNRMLKQEVADYLGVTSRTYYNWISRGKHEMPGYMYIKLADLFGTSTDYLLGLTTNRRGTAPLRRR